MQVSFKWLFLSVLLGLCLLMRCAQAPQTYASLQPDTEYVGAEACQSCHAEVAASYGQTNMGHSMYRPSLADTIEHFGSEVRVNDSAADLTYHPFWRGEEMYIREFRLQGKDTIHVREEQVDYVIGSGHQTRSYLMQRNGYLYELPITWYVHQEIWDLSPGYRDNNARFSREIGAECVACHTGVFDYVAGSKNRYRKLALGIGCENCHGPGAAHVRRYQTGEAPAEGEVDYSIVNPKHLPIQQQFDLCSRCHLEGVSVPQPEAPFEDFRPGMALQQQMEVFVVQHQNQADIGIASHAERLVQARCFIASAGKMTCTTCHDAHQQITSPAVYVQQCQSCHQAEEAGMCASPASQAMTSEQTCVTCHMPARGTVDIPHVRFHDHNIRILTEADSLGAQLDSSAIAEWLVLRCGTSEQPSDDVFGQAWLSYYEQQVENPVFLQRAEALLSQDQPYALARLKLYQGDLPAARRYAEQALTEQPAEPFRQFLFGEILAQQGEYAQAAATFDALYQRNADNLEAGLMAAVNWLKARRGDPQVLPQARQRFETLLAQKPFDVRLLTNLAFVALNQRDLRRAESALVQALGYDPDDLKVLENMVLVQVVKGNAQQGARYLARLTAAGADEAVLTRLQGMLDAG
jgi:cytochrome c-type biogenesis protein CcmH/NrfG